MEPATPTDRGQPTVQQMFATLLGEIASLREQNEEQQRQLGHLQRDVSKLQKKNYFERLPREIREMIWELAVPIRLLAFDGASEVTPAPSALSIPTIAHLCSESRRFVMSRKMVTTLSGRSIHLKAPSHLWRLDCAESPKCQWTWFSPRKDALVINPRQCRPLREYQSAHLMVQAAEHIIIDSGEFWNQYAKSHVDDGGTVTMTPEQVSQGVEHVEQLAHDLVGPANFTLGLEGDLAYNLRTIDFAMADFWKIDQDYPPSLVRRLFGVGDRLRILDLRDAEAVFEVVLMLKDELSKIIGTFIDTRDWPVSTLEDALTNFEAVANKYFPYMRAGLLRMLANSYHQATLAITELSKKRKRKEEQKEKTDEKNTRTTLPSPFKDNSSELNMEVAWVKELTKGIEIRPVFVFVRA